MSTTNGRSAVWRGSPEQLNALQETAEYQDHVTRGGLHLEGSGAIRGVTGEGVMEWMGALGGKLLQDMGFSNVRILEGGVQAWKDAGFDTEVFQG